MKLDPAQLRRRQHAALLSLVIGLLLFCMKMGGYIITGSAAILSDALESIVHIVATIFMFYSVYLSSRPADRSHPYGHGRIEFFSAGFEGAMIVLAAFSIFYVAIPKLAHPEALPSLGAGTLIVASAGAINLVLGFYLIAVGRREKSITLAADGRHVLTDSYTSIGVALGLVLVTFTGWTIVDPIIAMAVAINIVVTGFRLIKESVSGLMDQADETLIAQVSRILNEQRACEWIDVHRLRCWKSGEVKHLDFHLTLPYYLEVVRAHDIEKVVEEKLCEALDGPIQLLIHNDPCVPTCCSFCAVENCAVRQHELTQQKEFEPDEIVKEALYLEQSSP